MAKRHSISSCCGKRGLVLEFDKAVKHTDLPEFHRRGYASPPHMTRAGLFYVKKKAFIASGSFGAKKITVNCLGIECTQLINEFEALYESIVS